MTGYKSIYYTTESGRSSVEDFVRSLNARTRMKFFQVRGMLEEFGKKLPLPHAKPIGSDIYELRFRGQEGAVRVLYFFYHESNIVFTNGFIKKSGKVPKKEKSLAVERRKAYVERFG